MSFIYALSLSVKTVNGIVSYKPCFPLTRSIGCLSHHPKQPRWYRQLSAITPDVDLTNWPSVDERCRIQLWLC